MSQLPDEMWVHIFRFFGMKDQMRLRATAKKFNRYIDYSVLLAETYNLVEKDPDAAQKKWFELVKSAQKYMHVSELYQSQNPKDKTWVLHNNKNTYKKIKECIDNFHQEYNSFFQRKLSHEEYEKYKLHNSHALNELQHLITFGIFTPPNKAQLSSFHEIATRMRMHFTTLKLRYSLPFIHYFLQALIELSSHLEAFIEDKKTTVFERVIPTQVGTHR